MNTNEYLTALENFISDLQKYPETLNTDITPALKEMCSLLRICKIEMFAYDNEAAEHLGIYKHYVFYNEGQSLSEDDVFLNKRFTTGDDNIAIYRLWAADGCQWSDTEKHRIDILLYILTYSHAKSRLTGIAHHLTFYDTELDMFNLRQFMKCIKILYKAERVDEYTAVYFNLKRFSLVNQQIGRENGTLVMKKFIGLIAEQLDDEFENVCRIGGDNFITLIKQKKLPQILRLLNGTGIIYDELKGERILISATAGVYVIPDMDSFLLPTDIMDRVSMAFHLAKGSSKQDVVYFDDALLARSKRDNEITSCFPRALEDREFLVYYQPKVDITKRRVVGAEALCRWFHNGRLVPPIDFIPVLEQGRDICKLDFYMLDSVCRDIRRWLDSGKNVVRVSVNLSRRHLSDMDLLQHITEIIDRHSVPHEYIEIELTETTTDVEFKDLKRIISGLQELGISTAVDDFGTGYSSLNLLKEIPWDVVKLDKSLLPTSSSENYMQKTIMFRYIVAMTQEIGLECITEGVETIEQVNLLESNGCNLAQGFYFDKPLPVADFETRINDGFIYNR
ncbi:bifunctional diguanylate cyclase/phosphodiesterase [Ruminococcus flavefaciens]|uniref:putative bifunctional diguanylate cyclase/phosphodiesterase n=1 Tax=Ruminococcus flavefaciens TaxID=1265 RepID=UPI0026EF2816|nr:bifunctional diguanylate cyclase/phosphodiesterase [Ruminococcus flavefaciens]